MHRDITMANKRPSERDDQIVRSWLKRIYKEQANLHLSISYSKASPPAGTASFYSDSPYPATVVFECRSNMGDESNPFSYIRDWRD